MSLLFLIDEYCYVRNIQLDFLFRKAIFEPIRFIFEGKDDTVIIKILRAYVVVENRVYNQMLVFNIA